MVPAKCARYTYARCGDDTHSSSTGDDTHSSSHRHCPPFRPKYEFQFFSLLGQTLRRRRRTAYSFKMLRQFSCEPCPHSSNMAGRPLAALTLIETELEVTSGSITTILPNTLRIRTSSLERVLRREEWERSCERVIYVARPSNFR